MDEVAEPRGEARSGPKSAAARVKSHRDRKKGNDVQLAVGIAKLVTGQGAGEQRRVLMAFLEKTAGQEMPGDYSVLIERAVKSLSSVR